ncbi:CD9 antigen-like [Monodelphis domestica]|uniref:Tetraspanin n=1 Tax=Monodelphis domestica TaxID=13616 RepID=F6PFW3_MONDO|nr:CD9 antigen-like [Monodelphis domestica]
MTPDEDDGGNRCIKYLLFGFNAIFCLTGMTIFAFGLWLKFDTRTRTIFDQEDNSQFYTRVYIMIGTGVLMLLMSFLLCCGVMEESQCKLSVFFAFLLVLFAINIVIAIWGYFNKDKVIREVQAFYKDVYMKMRVKENPYKSILKALHKALDCCGLTGALDVFITETCPVKDFFSSLSMKSCPRAIEEILSSKFHVIRAVSTGIAVLIIFGMVLSLQLCRNIEDDF